MTVVRKMKSGCLTENVGCFGLVGLYGTETYSPKPCLPVLPKTFCQRLKMPKVQNAKTPIPQRVILPNLFHQQLNLPEQNTNHSNKDITWSTPGHDWQNGWKTIYVVSTCRDWRFYQSCSFLIWWLICFFHVILFYQCDWLPFWVWVGIISFLHFDLSIINFGILLYGLLLSWHFEPLVFCFCGFSTFGKLAKFRLLRF